MNSLINSNVMSMTSLEVADLTGKKHNNIIRDLKELEKQGVIDLLGFESIYSDSYGREQPCYNLPKRETLILTSGYSATQRAAIIDRWLELEGQLNNGFKLPQNYIEALESLLIEAKKVEALQAQIAADSPYTRLGRVVGSDETLWGD